MMNSWVYAGFDQTYRRMGVDFDKFITKATHIWKAATKCWKDWKKA